MNYPEKISSFLSRSRYEILLLSFMLLIFGNTFTPHLKILSIVFIYLNFIIGYIVFYNKKWVRIIIASILLLTICLDIFQEALSFIDLKNVHTILYLLFFSLVTKEVFKEVLYGKKVSRELLAAALCGFVLLCLIATFIFSFIDTQHPNSFSNINTELSIVDNLSYFSFTTLFTLGFGDITPLTLIAKRAVMFIGLLGHFYTVFVTSIIIGKYLSAKK